MAQRDIDIVSGVEDEFLRNQPGDYAVGTIVLMIEDMKKKFGQEFTAEGCLTALNRLFESAKDFHDSIEEASKRPI